MTPAHLLGEEVMDAIRFGTGEEISDVAREDISLADVRISMMHNRPIPHEPFCCTMHRQLAKYVSEKFVLNVFQFGGWYMQQPDFSTPFPAANGMV
jgi:hypothetical protein